IRQTSEKSIMDVNTILRRIRLLARSCGWLMLLLSLVLGAVAAVSAERGENSGPSAPARVRTWLTFGLDHVPGLQTELMGNPLLQYLAYLTYIILAFYGSKLLDHLIQIQLRKWAARTRTRLDELMLELLHAPVKVITFVVLLHFALRVFSWPEAGVTL